jgi:hypothetical protein
MQCPSCQFENMPGVQNCGRCGAALNLGAAAVDIYPPRARRWAKAWRHLFYALARQRRLPAGLAPGWDRIVHKRLAALRRDRIPWGLLLRMIIPGWPQFYRGRKLAGTIFLCGYLVSIPLGFLCFGTNLGSLFLGLVMTFHASSVADIVIAHADEGESRLVYCVACLALVGMLIYFPASLVIAHWAVPQHFLIDAPPFQAGDVIIYNPSAYRHSDPQIGDVAVYHLPNERIQVRHNLIYDFNGQEVVGRIIAGPGQRITFAKGQLKVDNQVSPWSDLFSEFYPDFAAATIPGDRYFILTGFARMMPTPVPRELWLRFSMAPRERIIGKVYFRNQPFSRFGFIR